MSMSTSDVTSGKLALQNPYAYAEIPLQDVERVILEKLPAGVAFTNVSFRKINLERPVLLRLSIIIIIIVGYMMGGPSRPSYNLIV